jgi:hypothetical protein
VKFGGNIKKNAPWFYYSTLQVYEQSYSQVRHIPHKMSDQTDFFHQTSWNIVGIFTVVCGSFWHVDKIQNGITMETEVPK